MERNVEMREPLSVGKERVDLCILFINNLILTETHRIEIFIPIARMRKLKI